MRVTNDTFLQLECPTPDQLKISLDVSYSHLSGHEMCPYITHISIY